MLIARIFVLLWFAAAFTLALTGWFEQFSSAALFGFGAIISATAFAFLHWVSENFRGFTRARSLRRMTQLQILRLFGVLALILAKEHVLPALFAIPTAIQDVFFALTAFHVAASLVTGEGKPERRFFMWHAAGLAGLGLSALLAVLTSSTRFGLAWGGITSRPMNQFPQSLVPVFIGPFVLILHLLALSAAYQHHYSAKIQK